MVRDTRFKVKLKKIQLVKTKITLDGEGRPPEVDEVPVLVERAPLKNFKEIKTIIGAFNFIKQEIPNVAFIRQGLCLNVKKDSSLGMRTKGGKKFYNF